MTELYIPLYNEHINLSLLQDCLQVPLDEKYNKILLYFYTDAPISPHDQFVKRRIKEYYQHEEAPLFLRAELWVWQGEFYKKKEMKEELIKREEAEEIRKHLEVITRTKVNFKCKYVIDQYAPHNYYNLKDGARWCRGWLKEEEF